MMKNQATNAALELVESLSIGDLYSTYSGERGACMCGCSGKYSYISSTAKEAGEDRGYAVEADEINDRSAKVILNKVKALAAEYPNRVEVGSCYVNVMVNTSRQYVLYPSEATMVRLRAALAAI